MNDRGDLVVVWSSLEQDGSGTGVYGQIFDPQGMPAGREFRVNRFTEGSQTTPVVAMNNEGDFVVSWTSEKQDGSGHGVYAQLFRHQPDNPFTPGDANRDGFFNSQDLVFVFQAGEYEDELPGNSDWSEGDWNGDGDFNTTDLIFAFQTGRYENPAGARDIQAAAVESLFGFA